MISSHAQTCRCFVLTPPGTGAIGLIRVLGSEAIHVVAQVFQSKSAKPLTEDLLAGGRLRYGWIVQSSERIDDVLVSSHQIAGEDAVDISAHGGVRIMERILGSLEAVGAVVSSTPISASEVWPVTNKIEAEALDALVRAKTPRAVEFLSWQRQHLAHHLLIVADSLEEKNQGSAKRALGEMLSAFGPARTLVEGATVALVGPPNSGKSTLFNALLGREGAVVSDIAGTTRDWVLGDVEMQGVPVELIDTAGQRDVQGGEQGVLERQAVVAGRDRVESADVTVVVLDASESASLGVSLVEQFVGVGRSNSNSLVVLNKADLLSSDETEVCRDIAGAYRGAVVVLSAKKSTGLAAFVELLIDRLGLVNFENNRPIFFTRRQIEQAKHAQDLLDQPKVAARFVREELIGSS